MNEIRGGNSLFQSIKDLLFLLFGLLGIMWAVEVLDLLPFFHLDRYGIHPRSAADHRDVAESARRRRSHKGETKRL